MKKKIVLEENIRRLFILYTIPFYLFTITLIVCGIGLIIEGKFIGDWVIWPMVICGSYFILLIIQGIIAKYVIPPIKDDSNEHEI